MVGQFVSQFTGLLTDWGLASFVAASLDWLLAFTLLTVTC